MFHTVSDSVFLLLSHGLLWLDYLWPAIALALVAWRVNWRLEHRLAYWLLGFIACHGVMYLVGHVLTPIEFSLDYSVPSRYIAWRHVGLGFLRIATSLLVSVPLSFWWYRMLNSQRIAVVAVSESS
jgi:hypothetical protein